jgi:hypothetical protein
MKMNYDNELPSILTLECNWECPETLNENSELDAETLTHPDMPGVCIKITEIDRKGGLEILLTQIYEQAFDHALKVAKAEGIAAETRG